MEEAEGLLGRLAAQGRESARHREIRRVGRRRRRHQRRERAALGRAPSRGKSSAPRRGPVQRLRAGLERAGDGGRRLGPDLPHGALDGVALQERLHLGRVEEAAAGGEGRPAAGSRPAGSAAHALFTHLASSRCLAGAVLLARVPPDLPLEGPRPRARRGDGYLELDVACARRRLQRLIVRRLDRKELEPAVAGGAPAREQRGEQPRTPVRHRALPRRGRLLPRRARDAPQAPDGCEGDVGRRVRHPDRREEPEEEPRRARLARCRADSLADGTGRCPAVPDPGQQAAQHEGEGLAVRLAQQGQKRLELAAAAAVGRMGAASATAGAALVEQDLEQLDHGPHSQRQQLLLAARWRRRGGVRLGRLPEGGGPQGERVDVQQRGRNRAEKGGRRGALAARWTRRNRLVLDANLDGGGGMEADDRSPERVLA